MGFSINFNSGDNNITRHLNSQFNNLYSIMEKLASGERINRASDGPAQLVISEQLRTQIGSLNAEINNTTFQIAKYQTASSAVGVLRSHLNEMRSLAVAAANEGGNSEASQEALDTAAQSLVKVYNNSVDSATYNGSGLLDGSANSLAEITDLEGIDLSSAEAAEASIEAIDQAIAEVDNAQVQIGSTQKNELEASRTSMEITRQNLIAAESQIRDTDYAKTYASFVSESLKIQMSVALLAHSNMSSSGVLSLLGSRL